MSAPVAVIPSRYAAQRFPGKPLVSINGKPMVQQVVERCVEAKCFSRVLVATDDERISAAVKAFGAEVMMTSAACASGTDRVAEVAAALGLSGEDVVINVQGDEPAVHPLALATLALAFQEKTVEMATLVRALKDHERGNANVVKAVLDEAANALYFSRAELPFQRDASGPAPQRWAHVGLYGYRARVLARLATLPPTQLEKAESLEQLRALGHGIRIACKVTPYESQSVDRPEDVPLAEAALARLAW